MKNALFYLFSLFVLFSCSTVPKTGATQKSSHKGRYVAQLDSSEVEIWSTYQEVATRRADGSYVRRMFFPETYKITSFQTFSDQTLRNAEGPYLSYTDKGELKIEGQYSANKRTGTWSTYRAETSQLRERGAYLGGKKEGEWTTFDEENRKTEIATYSAGDLSRKVTYDPTGAVLTDFRYADDEIVEVLAGEKSDAVGGLARMPLFAGCGDYTEATYPEIKKCADRKMLEFIYGRVMYPARARKNGVEGMGIVSFVVEKDGSIGDLKVVRGLNQDISNEMIRIVKLMPNWIPGKVDGENVRVSFNLPVRFKLE